MPEIKAWEEIPGSDIVIDGGFFNKFPDFFKNVFGNELPKTFGKALIFRSFRTPEGKRVERFAMLKENPAAKKLAITKDGLVIAVRQYKQGSGVCLEIPGGGLDKKGEGFEQLATRELLEETGYRPGSVIALGPAQYMSTRNSMEAQTHLFLARDCEKVGRGKIEDMGEDMRVELIAWDTWLELCHTQIIDPFSIVATFRAVPHLPFAK